MEVWRRWNRTRRRWWAVRALFLEIRVLGPLELLWDGRVIDVGGSRARALIARLLIDQNLTVPVDRLLDAFWSDQDSESAEKVLRTTVSRLRKRLRDAGVADEVIETKALGYSLSTDAVATDVYRFEQLVASGRKQLTRRNPLESIRQLKQAQDLWRGAAYSEVWDEPFARSEARRLEELRLTALECRFDGELSIGRHSHIVGELEALTESNPMRERLWSQRMLALFRSGRQAEALRVYQDLRAVLVAELGIEPGLDAQWLEHAMLEQSPDLEWIRPENSNGEAPSGHWPRPAIPVPTTWSALHSNMNEEPLVGRDTELATLRQWWECAQQRESRLLVMDGDAGIGKTRLVSELAREAEESGALVLWGRCDEDPVAPFQPFAEAFDRYFQPLSASDISTMPEWRLTELSRLVLRLSEHAPPKTIDLTDPEQDRFRFFGAVTDTLVDATSNRPVLLVLDDLHWADAPTARLLRHLLRDTRTARLGIVGLFRDFDVVAGHPLRTVLSELRNDRTLVHVHLSGLTVEAVAQLVQANGSSDQTLAAQLFQLTDGNPLFVDELRRQLSFDVGAATAQSGSTSPSTVRTPEAVKELVSRRVSRLPEDVIRFLHAAAVAGHEFDATVVAVAAELSPEQRMDAIDKAVESRLLHQVGETAEHYAFSHGLVRDAIYGQLPRSRRVRYHHEIAVAMENAKGFALDGHVSELAHHFYMGAPLADADKAVTFAYAAGDHALRVLAFEEAVGHFRRGLEVARVYGKEDPTTKCDALLALAEAQNKMGDKQSADRHFEEAAAVARAMHDPERLAMAAMRAGPLSYMGIVGANGDQVRLLEEARRSLSEEDSRLRAMVTARLGLVMVYETGVPGRGVLKNALSLSAEAVAMARRLKDPLALGYSLNARLHALWGIEPAPERLAIASELSQIADDVGTKCSHSTATCGSFASCSPRATSMP